jgi:hypothetical protein
MVADFVSLSRSAMKYLVALLLFSVPLHAQTGVWKASPLPVLPGGSYSLIDFADSVNGWIFSNNGRYVLTSDGGETWSAVRSLPDSMTVVQAKLYDGDTGIVFVSVRRIGGSTIYLVRTTDRGAAWDVLKLPAHVFGPGSVSIANRRIIACMGDSGGILRTTDLGSTWDTLARSVGPSRGEIGVMKNGRIFAWSPLAGMLNSGWLVTSADSGKTWSPVGPQSYMSSSWGRIYNENLASFALGYGDEYTWEVFALYNSSRDSIIFPSPGTSYGHWLEWGAFYDDGTWLLLWWGDALIRASSDPSDSTYLIQSGGIGPHVSDLATISPKFSWILSDSNTVFKRVDLLTGVAEKGTPPGNFRLFQNYPNPFNPSTTIRYALPGRAHVTLTIFNTLGQKVATPVNESQEAGYHDVRFDGSGVASGVYFYRFRAGEYVATKRLLLIR